MSGHTQTDLVLGTAGHIDHGKSSLVLALTGTDPDRLAEEKQRGITIELGFARLALPDGTVLGVVDVPGHERFVRQMIAGSTGIDLALLCIAADDGIMPQTEEHLAVLELLGIRTCVVALTKTDLVDEEWALFMADEVRGRLAGTPFADADIVPVSSRTAAGLPELQEALTRAARTTRRAKAGSRLRLPVDRVFSIKGAGTVVTGTLWSGSARTGDEVEVLPSGLRTRVRSVQVHGEPVDRADAGHRVALNLNAVSTDEVRPGDFLAAPGAASATDRFDAHLAFLGVPGKGKPLVSGARVHVAHGTREVTGRVLLMDGRPSLGVGERAYAQIRLDEPLPVAWRDRFVVRSYSPVHVVGGGEVLRARPRRTTTLAPGALELLDALREGDEAAVAHAAFALTAAPVTAAELATLSGLEEDAAARELEALAARGAAVRLGGRPLRAAEAARRHRERPAEVPCREPGRHRHREGRAAPALPAARGRGLLRRAAGRRGRARRRGDGRGRGEPSQSRSRRAQAGGAGRRAAARDAGRRSRGAAVHRRAHRIERPRLLARPPRAGKSGEAGPRTAHRSRLLLRRIGAGRLRASRARPSG